MRQAPNMQTPMQWNVPEEWSCSEPHHLQLCLIPGVTNCYRPQDLLRQLLTKEPSNRIKMDGLKVHPWVTCNGTLQPLQSSTDRSLERVYVMLQQQSEYV